MTTTAIADRTPEDRTPEDRTLKARHRALWALGDYGRVASTVIPTMGADLVDECGLGPEQRVLDVAAGTGNAAIPAALAGARVVACDLTPELLAQGRVEADRRGAELEWREADAERLPFEDGEFDAVVSCVGVMFAPDHAACAAELTRVCRPGGTLGLANWTPEGFVGRMFTAMRPYAPSPPPGALPPPLWGQPDHVASLLGERVTSVRVTRANVRVDCFDSPEHFRDFFRSYYGPTIAAYCNVSDDPDRVAGLDAALVELARDHWLPDGSMEWEYLLLRAERV